MNRQQIECFITVAEYCNFTDAAQRLYISQPALSRQLSGLEQELNCKLFNRNNKEVSLTQAGEILLEHFKKWNKQFNETLLEARLTEQLNKQNLKIGLISGLELNEFLEVIGGIQQYGQNNAVILKRMVHSEIVVALQKGQVNAAITFDDPLFDENNIGIIKLYRSGFDFVISRNHYLAGKGSISDVDIQKLMIAAQDGVIGTPREIYINTLYDMKKTFGETAIPLKIFTFPNLEDVIDFVESCTGAAIIKPRTQYNIDQEKFLKIPMVIKRPLVFAWNKKDIQPIMKELVTQVRALYSD